MSETQVIQFYSPKALKGKFCKIPFMQFYILNDGRVEHCYSRMTKKPIGNFITCDESETLLQMTQNKDSMDIKQGVLDGSFRWCDHQTCHAISNTLNAEVYPVPREQVRTLVDLTPNRLSYRHLDSLKQFERIRISLSYDDSCNLRCITCRDKVIYHKNPDANLQRIHDMTIKSIYELLDNGFRVQVHCSGSAEPFISKLYMDFFRTFDHTKYEKDQITLAIQCNAQSITPDILNIPFLTECTEDITVSTDGFFKDTYEKVRINGSHEKLHKNMALLNQWVRKLRTIRPVTFDTLYIVCKDNYQDIPAYCANMLRDYDQLDVVCFNPMGQFPHMSNEWYKDNAVHYSGHPEHQALLSALRQPEVLMNPKVNLNEFARILNGVGIEEHPSSGCDSCLG